MARWALLGTPIQLDRSFVQRPSSPSRATAGSGYPRRLPDRSIAHLPPATVQYTPTLPSLPWAICTAGGVDRTNLHTHHYEKPPAQSQGQQTDAGGPRNRTQKASVQGQKMMSTLWVVIFSLEGQPEKPGTQGAEHEVTELTCHSTRHRSPYAAGALQLMEPLCSLLCPVSCLHRNHAHLPSQSWASQIPLSGKQASNSPLLQTW